VAPAKQDVRGVHERKQPQVDDHAAEATWRNARKNLVGGSGGRIESDGEGGLRGVRSVKSPKKGVESG